jgi:TnpA family transposase
MTAGPASLKRIQPASRVDPPNRLATDPQQYDQMNKYATAIRSGTPEAETILKR